MRYWDDYPYFKPSIPREAKGGIKAQSKRGTFGESWWARRWIAVLESFNIGARLGRGRSYARRGQVLSIEIDKGKVSGKVQGSRPKPYDVKLQVKTLSASDWQKLAKVLSRQAIFSAKLLMGEMPLDIEKAFKEAGLSLFPEKLKDLKTACSCPDWSNPCKHIAAVYYLLAEEFDRDPFLIFKLRGMNREDLIAMLKKPGKKTTLRKAKPKQGSPEVNEKTLTSDISKFWNGEAISDDIFGEVRIPPIPAALPKRLGSFPFWRGEERFLDTMESIYAKASPVGLSTFLGELTKSPSAPSGEEN
ncbi:MAG: SWIM zinc finger family protein [Desulfobacterales bacterium]|nr:SWIM zinc finger family protein [Desulfobacterales bacterium]